MGNLSRKRGSTKMSDIYDSIMAEPNEADEDAKSEDKKLPREEVECFKQAKVMKFTSTEDFLAFRESTEKPNYQNDAEKAKAYAKAQEIILKAEKEHSKVNPDYARKVLFGHALEVGMNKSYDLNDLMYYALRSNVFDILDEDIMSFYWHPERILACIEKSAPNIQKDKNAFVNRDAAFWCGFVLMQWHLDEGISGEEILKIMHDDPSYLNYNYEVLSGEDPSNVPIDVRNYYKSND